MFLKITFSHQTDFISRGGDRPLLFFIFSRVFRVSDKLLQNFKDNVNLTVPFVKKFAISCSILLAIMLPAFSVEIEWSQYVYILLAPYSP